MEIEHSSQEEWQVQSLREADAVSILNRVSRRKEVEHDCTEGYWARSWSLVDHVEEAPEEEHNQSHMTCCGACRNRRNRCLHKGRHH